MVSEISTKRAVVKATVRVVESVDRSDHACVFGGIFSKSKVWWENILPPLTDARDLRDGVRASGRGHELRPTVHHLVKV